MVEVGVGKSEEARAMITRHGQLVCAHAAQSQGWGGGGDEVSKQRKPCSGPERRWDFS